MSGEQVKFVSRAGLKLAHALDAFDFEVRGLVCADFGCNVGGFTDCLLQRGAARVYAIDTGYGTLAWKLRSDDRVIVMERTNALHAEPPPNASVTLITIDLAWTPQRLAIPAALRWLAGTNSRIITLVKPHYELDESEKRELLVNGRLEPAEAHRVLERVMQQMPYWGAQPLAHTTSPITGKKSSAGSASKISAKTGRRSSAKSGREAGGISGGKSIAPGVVGKGNVEFLVLCSPQVKRA